MFCPNCGAKMSDDAKFCGSCGHSISPANISESPTTNTISNSQRYTTQQGPLGQAWRDITSTPGWIKRILLFMLMNCVPILNLYVDGYIVQWGADAARSYNANLPKGSFTKHTILVGLFSFILETFLSISTFVVCLIASMTLIGIVAVPFIALFGGALCMVATVRMAMFNRFGAAFDLSELFRKFKARLGGIFAASCVPTIVAIAVIFIIFLIVFLIGAGIGAATSSGYSNYDYYYYYNPISAISSMVIGMGALIIFIPFLILLFNFIMVFAQLWSYRALGRCLEQVAPDWAEAARAENDASTLPGDATPHHS